VPQTEVLFYREGNTVFFREWFQGLPMKAQAKSIGYLRLLRESGHQLRRPLADFLRDGIYELRPTHHGINYRILYFFCGRNVVVVSHGIVKESGVPDVEIERALERKRRFASDPEQHAFRGVIG